MHRAVVRARADTRPESSSVVVTGGSGSSIGGSSRLHSPVISRVLRPRVKNDHAQRIVTTIRFANPMRYRMWMPSHIAQARNPDSCPNGPSQPMFATPRNRPIVATSPLSV